MEKSVLEIKKKVSLSKSKAQYLMPNKSEKVIRSYVQHWTSKIHITKHKQALTS